MAVVERRVRDCRKTSHFLNFASNTTSQGGEDGILSELFRLIGVSTSPYCVDVGAWDGKHLSNTFCLLSTHGWGGLLCEADPVRLDSLSQLYRNRPNVVCVNKLVSTVGESSLVYLLKMHNVNRDFDFLSIDIDGGDYHLWQSLGDSYAPRVVCIEFNPTIPNHVVFIQENDSRVQQGSSLLALVELGKVLAAQEGGYQLVCTTTFNAIFVRSDLMSKLPAVDYSIDSLHSSSMITDMFQTYDGEIVLCGPKKLIWHRTGINVQKMQPLTKRQRSFPYAPPNFEGKGSHLEPLEGALSDIVSSVNSIYHAGAESMSSYVPKLEGQLTTLRNVCKHGLKGGNAVSDIAIEALISSVCVVSRTVKVQHSTYPALTSGFVDSCVRHISAVSALIEERADKELHNKSSSTSSVELYKHALFLSSLYPIHAMAQSHKMHSRRVKDACRLALKLSKYHVGRSADGVGSITEGMFWICYMRLMESSQGAAGADIRREMSLWNRAMYKRTSALGSTLPVSTLDATNVDHDVIDLKKLGKWEFDDMNDEGLNQEWAIIDRACGRVNLYNNFNVIKNRNDIIKTLEAELRCYKIFTYGLMTLCTVVAATLGVRIYNDRK